MTESPFFIIGCGRSGTTLLRTMLNNHPDVAVPTESLFIIDYLLPNPLVPISTFRKLIVKEYELSEWGIKVHLKDIDGCSSVKDLIDKIHNLYMEKKGKRFWGQKTPRFIRYSKILKETYPGAKFVHIIRDPRAVASSLIRSNVHESNVYFAALRWFNDVNAGLKLKGLYPDDVLDIRFEDLILHPNRIFKKLCRFLAINFYPGMIEFCPEKKKEKSLEYSQFYSKITEKIGQLPDSQRIEAWRSHLSPRQISVVESICWKTMKSLNYKPDYNNQPEISFIYLIYLKFQRIFKLVIQIFYYIRRRPGYLLCNLRRKLILSRLFKSIGKINY